MHRPRIHLLNGKTHLATTPTCLMPTTKSLALDAPKTLRLPITGTGPLTLAAPSTQPLTLNSKFLERSTAGLKSLRKQTCFVALCASVLLSSCHSKNTMARSETDAPSSLIPDTSSPTKSSPLTRSRTSRSTPHSSRHFGGGHNIATYHGRKSSPHSDTKMMNTDTLLKANYKIAGIGHAQNPSTIYNWNWAGDFGGTVDAVTISF